jgi:hypothetical protein
MPTTPLFPLPEGLEITSLSETPEELLVRVTSHRQTSCCPTCSTPSSAIHSYYRRKPRDLPCVGRPIRLLLTVRKFFCRNPHCSRKVFTERFPDFIEASSRLTKRLRTAVQEIGFATCGKGGERLSEKLGIPISDVTVLCSLFLIPLPEVGQVRVVGVDDWSATRSCMYSCKDSRKEDLTWNSASSAEPSLNQVRLGQCSHVRIGRWPTREGRPRLPASGG